MVSRPVRMFIVELEYPGSNIVLADPELAERIQRRLAECQDSVTEAAIALYRFETASAAWDEALDESNAQWEADQKQVHALTEAYLTQLADPSVPQELWSLYYREEARYRAERDVKRQHWQAGQVPSKYLFMAPFMDAKAFVSALDTVRKLLTQIKDESGVPLQVAQQVATFQAQFPGLKRTRDSIQHIDERILYQAWGKSMPPRLGTALQLENLVGNRIATTAADGSTVDVEVSQQSLEQAVTCVQGVINAFTWTGDKQHYLPSSGRRFW
jgi:hypothetical protein